MNVVVLVMILEGSICGGFSYVFAFTYIHQAGVQMMDSGMMGSNINVTRNMMKTQGQLVSVQDAIRMMHDIPVYAKINSHNNTITFDAKDVKIVALAMMSDKAINLTRTQPPSYSKGDVFVISGLINPTLVVPKDASVQFIVVNLDDGMYHNLLISSVSPPYPYMATSSMGINSSYPQGSFHSNPSLTMTSLLPPVEHSSAHEYSYRLIFDQVGSLWYFCTNPSHAQEGMYGKIIVT